MEAQPRESLRGQQPRYASGVPHKPRARERARLEVGVEEQLGLSEGLIHLVFVWEGSEDDRWFSKVLRLRTLRVDTLGEEG